MVNIQIKKFNASVDLPSYGTDGSAAIDLSAEIPDNVVLGPGNTELIPSGIGIHINNSLICAMIVPRSGLGVKRGLILSNSVGIIDSDYTGEIMISAWNRSKTDITITPHQRIAQLIFLPIIHPQFVLVDEFGYTPRGDGGFGSTG